MKKGTSTSSSLCPVGIAGLDDILIGGLPRGRVFLVRGSPGTGKTTMGLQFLMEGRRRGEAGLYFTLSETRDELEEVARSHEWNLDGINLIDLSAIEKQLTPEAQSTLLHPAEQELGRTMKIIEEVVDRTRPLRIVCDSLSELRLMSDGPFRYRRQILGLKTFFSRHDCTVMLLDDDKTIDNPVESVVHGVIELQQVQPLYGAERRRITIVKMRGVKFRGGYHDYAIRTEGLDVYPRLVAAEHHVPFAREFVPSGLGELDMLLGGGLDRGTSSLFLGPAGSGKSTVSLQFAIAAAQRGEMAAGFLFDESIATLSARCKGLGCDVEPLIKSGKLHLQQVDPAELSPGEFAALVRRIVENKKARIVMIDSLNGYLNAMPDEKFLVTQLHELLTYLGQQGVASVLVLAQHGFIGSMPSPIDLTYLADTVVMLRYFEFEGSIRKAISVVKKRSGGHEATIREIRFEGNKGLRVGSPLSQFQGVLNGVPIYKGDGQTMFEQNGDEK